MRTDCFHCLCAALPRAAVVLLVALLASATQATAPSPMLTAGTARLSIFVVAPHQFGVAMKLAGTGAFAQAAPLAVDVIDTQGTDTWLTGGYSSAVKIGSILQCSGTLTSIAGTRFFVTDTYRTLPHFGAFTMTRNVRIEMPQAADAAFNSRFTLIPKAPTPMDGTDFFVPGVWYKDNAHVPPSALASHQDDHFYYIREDRLPLPLVAMRDKRTGLTMALAHVQGDSATFAGENGRARIVDTRMQFGALGIVNASGPAPTFLFPGTEGERTYVSGASKSSGRWAYRSHPVRVGVPHRYTLLLQICRTASFPDAVRHVWRTVYAHQMPPVAPVNLPKVYADGMKLLAADIHPYDGTISVPFAASVPSGVVNDTSSEMGFVGDALPAAALLLKYGLDTGNADAVTHGSDAVDFWARNSPTPAGLPRTWYDVHPDGRVTFRNYHTFLRVACDGLDGALRAWEIMRRHGRNKPEWLAFCRTFGDWLVRVQAPNGSWARAYDFAGQPVNPAQDTTDQAIPFLADLYFATGDASYKAAALRAGAFCWAAVHQAYAYVGGTPDNPNVADKEGGMEALAAFLSLYDLTQSPRWLAASAQAASYCETWVYCWNIPVPDGDPKVIFPHSRTTVGLSLIATGHSGADNYMAAAPFLFYRLFLLTGDTHDLDFAEHMLRDTKQMTDWDGTLGYAQPGLLTEALTLAPPRGHGVTHWLPWLTVTLLEPLVRLQETFGSIDITSIEALPKSVRLSQNAAYGRTHGFAAVNPRAASGRHL